MSKYAVVCFPKGELEGIRRIRELYDPKVELVAPHITLVFPFAISSSEDALIRGIESKLAPFSSFSVCVDSVHLDPEDSLLHVRVSEGKEQVEMLHDALYTGMLEQFWRKDLPYVPHITIGSFRAANGSLDEQKYKKALDTIATNDVCTTLTCDEVCIIKIESPLEPRIIVKRFVL